MAKKKETKKSKFIINVPIFVSKRQSAGGLFELTYDDLIKDAKESIDNYNTEGDYIILNKRNKLFQKQIGKIDYTPTIIGEVPALLLNISCYTLNKSGEHIKETGTVTVEPSDRIGDNRNHILLLPEITGEVNKHYNWLALVYDDPSRESEEIISIVKSLMTEIIRQPIKNIKLPTLLTELKKASPKIILNLNSVTNEEDGIGTKFEAYLTESKSFEKREFKFSGMPLERIEELIKDRFDNRYKLKLMRFLVGQKEYKIKQEIANFNDGVNLLVEQHFNFIEEIPPSDLDKVYTPSFIISIMEKVITKYFTNGED